jgi:hypothetical protein
MVQRTFHATRPFRSRVERDPEPYAAMDTPRSRFSVAIPARVYLAI